MNRELHKRLRKDMKKRNLEQLWKRLKKLQEMENNYFGC